MEDAVLNNNSLDRIRSIHGLSLSYNKKLVKDHTERLLELVREHAEEITELAEKKDPHFLVETGDLAILCFEILLEHSADIDSTLLHCFERYEKKLTGLIKEQG